MNVIADRIIHMYQLTSKTKKREIMAVNVIGKPRQNLFSISQLMGLIQPYFCITVQFNFCNKIDTAFKEKFFCLPDMHKSWCKKS